MRWPGIRAPQPAGTSAFRVALGGRLVRKQAHESRFRRAPNRSGRLATHKFAINDREYEVEVGSRQGNRVQVTVNGTLYDVELKPSAIAPPRPMSRASASVPPP